MRKITFLLISLFLTGLVCAQEKYLQSNQKEEFLLERGYKQSNNPIVNNTNFSKENVFVDIGGFTGFTAYASPIPGGGGNSYYQSLYFQSEINVTGKQIKSISYYYEGEINWAEKIEVYIGHSDSTRLRNWEEVENLTRVFSGEVSSNGPSGWLKIDLTHPFVYNNEQNLIIGVIDNQKNNQLPLSTYFWETPTDDVGIFSGPKLTVGASLTGPLTAQWHSWELKGALGLRPDIRIEFEDIPEKAVLLYKPVVADYIYYHDFGALKTGDNTSEEFYIENIGNKSIVIDELTFEDNAFTCNQTNIEIPAGESFTFTVNYNAQVIGDHYFDMKLNSKDSFDGDSIITLRATVYERGYLYEGFEIKPEDYPPFGWDYTGIDAPADWFMYSNWYINDDSYPETYCYERLSLIQSRGYEAYGRDTLITPLLDIKAGDSLTFYAYDDATPGEILPIYYTADKKTYHHLKDFVMEGYDWAADDPRTKWTKYVIDLSEIPGKYHICFVELEHTLPHIDQVEGPKLAVPDNDMLILNFEGPTGISADADNIFKATVLNNSNSTVANYSVKLMKKGSPNVELYKIDGSDLAFLGEKEFDLVLNTSELGEIEVYAEVVVEIDDDLSNNTSSLLDVTIYSNTSITKEFKDNDAEETGIFPLNFNWVSNMGQGIYYADELQLGACTLNEMNFHIKMMEDVKHQHIKFWIGETDKNDLSEGMISAHNLTLVYDQDSVDFLNGDYTLRIPFDTPYEYTGKNLVFLIQKTITDSYHGGLNQFYVSHNPNHKKRSISYFHRSSEVDPYNPPNPDDIGSIADHSYLNWTFDFYADATFYFDVAGLGKINGTVTVADGSSVADVNMTVDGTYFYSTTDNNGAYEISNINPGQYDVTAEKFGYETLTKNATVVPDFYQTIDYVLSEKPKQILSGKLIDHNGNNISDAKIQITGYEDYELVSDVTGNFSETIWANETYEIAISAYGFKDSTFNVTLEQVDLVLADIVLVEIAAFPDMISVTPNQTNAIVTWGVPEPAIEHEYRYDSEIASGRLGFNGSEKSQLGTVYRNKALITHVHFYLHGDYTADEVVVHIYGLNSNGRPNPKEVLHISDSINAKDNAWTTYKLDVGIYAEKGFYIGLNSSGFLGLGVAENTEEHPFKWETHFHTWSLDDTYSTYYFLPSEFDNNKKNLMIRAHGFNYGEVYYDNLPGVAETMALKPEESKLTYDKTESVNTQAPVIKYTGSKALTSYTVYRFNETDLNNSTNWTVLGTNVTETTYTDTEWETLEKGVYYYAVEAIYDSGNKAYIRKSEKVGKDMESEVTVKFTLPEKTDISNVCITLEQKKTDGEKYIQTNLTNNQAVFQNIWNDTYVIEVNHNNCLLHRADVNITNTEELFEINLQKAFPAPVELNVIASGINKTKLSWENVQKEKVILDDGTHEVAFFILPAQYAEFGNYYTQNEQKILTNVHVYGSEHIWASRENKVYLNVYNNAKELIGRSEDFELPYNAFINVPLPNIKIEGNHYITVCWDYIIRPTNQIGLDTDGEIAIAESPAVYRDKQTGLLFIDQISEYNGAFIMHPEYYKYDDVVSQAAIINNKTLDANIGNIKLTANSLKGEAKSANKSKGIQAVNYNVYKTDFTTPYAQNVLVQNYVFDNISENTYQFGVSAINNWGESDIATIEYTYVAPSDEASLKSILIDTTELVDFEPSVYNYIVNVADTTINYPTVTAHATDSNALVVIENNNTEYVNIVVTSQSNLVENYYSIFFNKTTNVESIADNNIVMYPNPAANYFTLTNAMGYKYAIFNQLGQLVTSGKITNNEYSLNIQNLHVGIHTVQLINEQGNIVNKKLNIIE